MPFFLKQISLLSQKIRISQLNPENLTNFLIPSDDSNNSVTKRVIDSVLSFNGEDTSNNGIVSNIFNIGKKLLGFASKSLSWLAISAVKIVEIVKQATIFILTFDWNQTDSQMQALIENRRISLAAAWGGLTGEAFGAIAAIGLGYGITFYIPVLGPTVAKNIALKVLEEKGADILGTFISVLQESAKFLVTAAAVKSYLAIRNYLKKKFPAKLKNWGSGEPWKIGEKLEEQFIDSIDSKALQAFTEEFAEESFESFFDTAFIFAREIDDHLAQAKTTSEQILGTPVSARLALDEDSGEQVSYPPNLPSNMLKTVVLNDINRFRAVRNRDIGFFTGEQIIEESRRFNFLRTAKIIFRGEPYPPYKDSRITTITLKDLKTGLLWKDFKRALKQHNWGPHYVWATLNKSRHEIGAWFGSKEEGEAYIKELIEELIDDDYIALDHKEEVDRNKYVRKSTQAEVIYPAFLTITIKNPVASRDDASHDLSGNSYLVNKFNKIPLWTDDEPILPLEAQAKGGVLT